MTVVKRIKDAGVRVAVLCGGPGGEREVSLASGDNVHQALRRAGLDNELVVVPPDDPGGFLERVDCGLAVMMLHGEFGEDGAAQSILERRGIAYTGSGPEACAHAMDKNRAKLTFVKEGIPTPKWVVAEESRHAAALVKEKGLRYPLFVKPNDGGSSVETHRVMDASALEPAAEQVVAGGDFALIEEMVVGREFTIGWLAGRTLPVIELQANAEFYDYHAKYLSAETRYICPAPLPESVTEQIAGYVLTVAECLGVRDLSRVDVMLGEDGPKVLELNALPGFTSHSLLPMAAGVAGIGLEELCLELAAMAAKRAGII